MKRKILWQNKWLRTVLLDGWFTAHEPASCKDNKAVAVLPYKVTWKGKMYLARYELNPAHMRSMGTVYHQVSCITGACETGNARYHAKMEVLEESGYDIPEERFVSHGIVCPSKTSCTKLNIFSVRILGKDKRIQYCGDGNNENEDDYGDGSKHESKEYADWVDAETMKWAKDPYIHTIMMRMK